MTIVLEGIVGSQAYGLATPESDIDKLGVFVAPNKDILGMQPVQETRVTNDPDVTLHEVRKYLALAAKGNPTVLELLFLRSYSVMTDVGELLIENKDAFLSQRIRKTYGGYALQQVKRLERRGDGSYSSDLRKRRAKHQRHIARLVVQCTAALKSGTLVVRLSPSEIEEVRRVEVLEDEQLSEWFEQRLEVIDNMETDLPEDADWDRINTILLQIRGVK